MSGSASVAVNDYQAMINAAYTDYWQLRNLAFSNGRPKRTTSLGSTVLTEQAVAKNNITDVSSVDPTLLQQMIRTEATQRFERAQFLLGIKTQRQLADWLTTLFGASLAGNAVSAGRTDHCRVDHGAWRLRQEFQLRAFQRRDAVLADHVGLAVDAGPVDLHGEPRRQSGQRRVAARDLGHQCRHQCQRPAGDALRAERFDREAGGARNLSFTSVDSSHRNATQKALLASAGPGQLHVDSQTDAVTGIVTYTVAVTLDNLLVLNPLGRRSPPRRRDDVYLGSKYRSGVRRQCRREFGPITGPFETAGGVQTTGIGGDVKLDAVGNIVAGVAGQTVISGRHREG